MSHNKRTTSSRGFTIVELLIVVVVIAILAAITIVAYNGIQNRAKASAAQSAASQANKKVALWRVDNADQSPSLADFTNLVSSSNMNQYQYSQGANGVYCITATISSISYKISSTQGTPIAGACDGHGANGIVPITNLATNPSVETSSADWGLNVNGSTSSRTAGAALFGGYGISSSVPANNLDSGVGIPVAGPFVAGTTYTASATIKAVTGGTYLLSPQGTGGTSNREVYALAAGETRRINFSWTTATTGAISLYAIRQGSTGSTASTFYIDGIMLTTGSNIYTYADGNSSGWAWTGALNNSTSTGAPL